MGQHSPIPPDDCASCTRVFARLRTHYEAGGGRLLATVLGADVDLRPRALRVHLAHLEEHRRIEADRRTPVPGATVQPAAPPLPANSFPKPLDWALTIECPDRTCRRMLLLLAREADLVGQGQMGLVEIAESLGCSVRCAQTHRAHLVEADLLRVEADVQVLPSGKKSRGPDRYILSSQYEQPPSGTSWEGDAALELLAQVPWWKGAAPKETDKAVARLLRHLRSGWPAHELERRVTRADPKLPIISRIALLRSLLPKIDEAYVVPAIEHLAARHEPVEMVVCPECDRPYPRAQRVRTGQVCPSCRTDDGLLDVPVVRGRGTPAF